MNQDKLEVVKQEMARVNVNILGISELRRPGMGEFNSDAYMEWVAISFSRGIFLTQGSNPDLPHCRQTFYHLTHQRNP